MDIAAYKARLKNRPFKQPDDAVYVVRGRLVTIGRTRVKRQLRLILPHEGPVGWTQRFDDLRLALVWAELFYDSLTFGTQPIEAAKLADKHYGIVAVRRAA